MRQARFLAAIAVMAMALPGTAALGQSSPAYAPTTLSATQILAKGRAARGTLAPGVYREREQTSGGGLTSETVTFIQGGNEVGTTHTGPFTTAYGTAGEVNWEQDPNGIVTLTRDRKNPYDVALTGADAGGGKSPAGSDAIAGSVTVLGVTNSQPALYVVEVKPRPGLTQRRYYDAERFLLRRTETTDYDGRTLTQEYGDYKTAYGLTFPQTETYDDGHAENASRTQVEAFEAVPSSAASFAIPASRAVYDLGGRSSLEIPSDFTPDGIIVRVTIGGRTLDFGLDSGASTSVIDSGVAKQLGLPLYGMRKATLGGEYAVSATKIPQLQLGEIEARDVTISAIPFDEMVGDRKIVGLLGGEFFASARISVDFQKSALWMLAPSPHAPEGDWHAVPLDVNDGVPRVRAKFNGKDGEFILDLGAFSTMLYPHYFHQFQDVPPAAVIGKVGGVSGDTVDYRGYTFSRFDLGDLAFTDANVVVPNGTLWEERDYDGLLGRNMLANFRLLFDYPNRTLYLKVPE